MENKNTACAKCNSHNVQIISALEKEKKHTKLATAITCIGFACFALGIIFYFCILDNLYQLIDMKSLTEIPKNVATDYLLLKIANAITPFGVFSIIAGIAIHNLTPFEYYTRYYAFCLDCGNQWEIRLKDKITISKDSNKTYVEQLLENKKKN